MPGHPVGVRSRYAGGQGSPRIRSLDSVLIVLSALSFLAYGLASLLWPAMKREFDRYGLGWARMPVGGLQVLAAFGLLAGLGRPWMGRAAAVGLAVMMLVAVAVRIRINDTLVQTIPALVYLVLNAYLSVAAF